MEDIIITFFMLMFAILLFLLKIVFYVYEKIRNGVLAIKRLWLVMIERVYPSLGSGEWEF